MVVEKITHPADVFGRQAPFLNHLSQQRARLAFRGFILLIIGHLEQGLRQGFLRVVQIRIADQGGLQKSLLHQPVKMSPDDVGRPIIQFTRHEIDIAGGASLFAPDDIRSLPPGRRQKLRSGLWHDLLQLLSKQCII